MSRKKSHAPKAFIEGWSRQFADVPAAGWLLRQNFPDRWIRFHALPGSKRYAETPAEEQSVVERARSLGDALFTGNGRVWLVEHVGWYRRDEVDPNQTAPGYLMPTRERDDMGADFLCVAISRPAWPPQNFDELSLAIADDRTRALFADLDAGRVLAPYDGGFDLICATRGERNDLKDKFRAWLSSHPLGL